ncbi:hypothetical protein [Alkalitalea saponilacus]|uniref:Uncharacterized protein n=1 Tax=Alkalitalea saponilacus TaxID=889453 RepID=A0A1T5HT44_9BACT|nr:hypothetical protein [Alkalitalea saponilacus]ASB48537.1 hypothetical protein CDL62_04980 [Alkalitalea saponilacus]SKC23837.1 hypothetical protein SAMN03080601_03122 [Alkalitalea saponilacus]
MKKFNLLILLGVFIFVGCSDQDFIVDESKFVENNKQETRSFQVKDGVLVFSDFESLDNTLELFLSMDVSQYQVWLDQNNMQTLLGAYNEICLANDQLDELVLSGIVQHNSERLNADVYYDYLKKGIIVEYLDDETNEIEFDLATPTPYWASVLNHDGVFVVGDSLFYVTENLMRIIPWDNKGSLKSSLNLDNIKFDEGSVWVLKSQNDENQLKSFDATDNRLDSKYVYSSGRGRRTRIQVKFQSWQFLGDGTMWRYIHYLDIRNQYKNGIRGWRDRAYPSIVMGDWSGHINFWNGLHGDPYYRFSSGYTQSFYNVYRAFGNVSILDGSGGGGNGESEWDIYFTPRKEIYDVKIEKARWKIETPFATAKIEYGGYTW